MVVVVVVVVSHVVQVHPEKDLSRVVPSKLYVYGCCFCLFVVVVVVSHVVQVHPEKDLSRVVPSKLYVCRCNFVCLFVCLFVVVLLCKSCGSSPSREGPQSGCPQ